MGEVAHLEGSHTLQLSFMLSLCLQHQAGLLGMWISLFASLTAT